MLYKVRNDNLHKFRKSGNQRTKSCLSKMQKQRVLKNRGRLGKHQQNNHSWMHPEIQKTCFKLSIDHACVNRKVDQITRLAD